MRRTSTPTSAIALEPTWLAVFETVASVALYLALCHWVGSFLPLAVGIALAPLTLLRTEQSISWGLSAGSAWGSAKKRWTDFVSASWERVLNKSLLLAMAMVPLVVILDALPMMFSAAMFPAFRTVTTVAAALARPLDALRGMPNNWVRQTLCMDFHHPPEVLPGSERVKTDHVPVLRDLSPATEGGWGAMILMFPFWLLAALMFVPAAVYRITFKATAVVYAPLVFVAKATLDRGLGLKSSLARITKGEFEKLRRWWARFALAVLLAKVLVLLGLLPLDKLRDWVPSDELIAIAVVPDSWPAWQIAVAGNALLTFGLLYWADAMFARLEARTLKRERVVANTLDLVTFTRGALSIYTVTVGFLISANLAFPAQVQQFRDGLPSWLVW